MKYNIKILQSVFIPIAIILLQIALPLNVYAAGISVNTLVDEDIANGTCSLREAIIAANTDLPYNGCPTGLGSDVIGFSVPGTITLGSTLPTIASSLSIDGGGLITLSGNNAYRIILVDSSATLNINDLVFTNALLSAGTGGAAIFIPNGATANISNSTFSNSSTGVVTTGGGAIYNAGVLTIANSTFSGNSSNGSSDGGGAIYNAGTIHISGSTFTQNVTTGSARDGGAILSKGSSSSLIVENSTFYANSAGNPGDTPPYYNGTGGAIKIQDSNGTNMITHVTVSNNVNENLYGALDILNSNASVSLSILANSVNGLDCSKRGTGAITSTNNLIEMDSTCNGTIHSDPSFGALQNNGGPTQTMAINATSPAYNFTTSCPLTNDQRGVLRPQPMGGKCDLGAYEFNSVVSVTNITSIAANGIYGTGSVIKITISFSETVYVTGTPQLILETGSTDQIANYTSGSGTSTLAFTYTVQPGDTSSDLDYVSSNSLVLNGGTIKDSMTNNADLRLPNPGNVGSLGANKALVIDTTAPTLTSFTRQNPATSLTNADTLVFRVTFNEAVTNVDSNDFIVNGTTTATVTNVSTISSNMYNVTVSGGDLATFNNSVGLDLKPTEDITDLIGNMLSTAEPSIDEVYTLDNISPSIYTILRTNINPTSAVSLNFTVTFTENVTGVSTDDFVLTATVIGASITNVTGSGTTYTVTVNTGTGNGTIRLDVIDDDSIKDAAGNSLGGTGIGNGNFINGEIYTIAKFIGADTAGVFRPSNGLLYLKNTNDTGFADIAINYGIPGDYPVVGDWDGNGTVTIGVYRGGKFYLKNMNTVGFADVVFAFGQVGDQPIAGDWDGDGIDTIGVYRPSTGQFLLRNSNDAGPAEMSFYLGNVGDVGIAGDWNGDGKDTVGVFRPSNGIIFLKNTNTTGFADVALNYGIPGDKPVVGDWNNDGTDTIGVYRNGIFYLRDSNTVGFADYVFGLGNPGDMPIAGNWDGQP